MLAILGLIGLGLILAEIVDSDSSESQDTAENMSSAPEPEPVEVENASDLLLLSDTGDVVADESYRSEIEASFQDLVNEGEITRGQSADGLAQINFSTGAINVDTAGGDDVVLAGDSNDIISMGDGDDLVFGGAGDDVIDLGRGTDEAGVDDRVVARNDDLIGFPTLDETDPRAAAKAERSIEGGDDRILGGPGDDLISDSYGSNIVNGQQGDDIIVTVDAADDQITPDRVSGGFGFDTLIVDQGDTVETGRGFDTVTVDVFAGVSEGYQTVTILDFEKGKDTLELEGGVAQLRGATPEGPDDVITPPVTVAPTEDGMGSVVSIDGIPVVEVIGVPDLGVEDILLST